MMDVGILFLRLGLGIMFMAHGLQKTFGLFGGPGVKAFSKMLAGLGFAPPLFWAYLASCTELVGGLLLIVGLFSRGAALFLLVLIVVAGLKVHLKNGFFLSAGGFEYVFVIAAALIALILLGPGKISLYGKF